MKTPCTCDLCDTKVENIINLLIGLKVCTDCSTIAWRISEEGLEWL